MKTLITLLSPAASGRASAVTATALVAALTMFSGLAVPAHASDCAPDSFFVTNQWFCPNGPQESRGLLDGLDIIAPAHAGDGFEEWGATVNSWFGE